MEVDSDKSFVCDRGSLHYGCSPDLGTAASTTKVCTIGENSKRKVSPADFEYQSLSTNRGKDGPDEGSSENPDRPRKRRKGDPSLPYACPYFINSPDEYPGCAKWQKKELHRVKYESTFLRSPDHVAILTRLPTAGNMSKELT